jgi:hypothetical protein
MMSPREWLLCDVARSYGLDKASWSERLAWAVKNVSELPGAKEPFLYRSALKASQAVTTDHLISLDATASGIQCLSLMAQDSASALEANLGSTGVRNPYQRVCELMGGESSPYPYKHVKEATMTAFYESVAVPMNFFGKDYDKFVQAASKMLPGPWAVKEAIASCMTGKDFYSWTMMDGFVVNMEVTAPVECSMDIGGLEMKWIEHRRAAVATKGLTANVTHSLDALVLREVIRRTHCNYEWNDNSFSELRPKDIMLMQSVLRWRMSKFLSVEFLQYMDEHNGVLVPQDLREAVDNLSLTESMYIQPIHDCYRVKATDASKLFVIVREVMADLAYSKSGYWILTQLGYKGALNDSEAKRIALKAQVLRSEYLIC